MKNSKQIGYTGLMSLGLINKTRQYREYFRRYRCVLIDRVFFKKRM